MCEQHCQTGPGDRWFQEGLFTYKSPAAGTPALCYLLAVLLLFRVFLIVFFVSVESGGVNAVQALRPLPVESTELLFAVERRC